MTFNQTQSDDFLNLNIQFLNAIENNELIATEKYIQQGADLNTNNSFALIFSINNFNNDLFSLLIKYNAKIDTNYSSLSTNNVPLFQACYVGNLFVVDYFVKTMNHICYNHSHIIDSVIRGGQLNTLIFLLNNGIEPIASFDDVFYPLKKCIIYKQKEIFHHFLEFYHLDELSKLLFQLNCNPNPKDIKKIAPFIETLSFYIQSKTLYNRLDSTLIEQKKESFIDKKIKL